MKNLLAEIKVKEYFLRLNPLQAKKILFAMEQMKGNDRMDESDYTELRQIAGMYDGIINASFARDLAKRLVTEYSNSHPDVFMTQKEANCYTEANHAKLLTALGLRGFDYVMAVLRQGKEYVSDRANGVDEYRMLQAMRWDEQRENIEPTISNLYHRKKGLQLVGFEEMADFLVAYSFVIANVYEQVTPANQQTKEEKFFVRKMKIHFIKKAELIEEFYRAEEPVVPKGYTQNQLEAGTMLLELATNGQLKDSDTILEYYKAKVNWDSISNRLVEEFSEEECEIIREKAEFIKELIKNNW